MTIKHSDEYVSDEQLAAMGAVHAALAAGATAKPAAMTYFVILPFSRLADAQKALAAIYDGTQLRGLSGTVIGVNEHAASLYDLEVREG